MTRPSLIVWRQMPDTTYPNGWTRKEERAVMGRCFMLNVHTDTEDLRWRGQWPGVCLTGEYATPDAAKVALLRLVERTLKQALKELGET